MPRLSPDQVRLFRRDGVVVVPALIPPATLSSWREQFWEACQCDAQDAATWPGSFEETVFTVSKQASTNQPANPLVPALGHVPELMDIVRQLGGSAFAEGQRPALTAAEKAEAGVPLDLPAEPIDHILVHWPPETKTTHDGTEAPAGPPPPFRLADAGHIDGGNGNKGGWRGGFMLTAITYIDDLDAEGGGTNYWPGSCHPVHKFMHAHPGQHASGTFANSWGFKAPNTDEQNQKMTDLAAWGGVPGSGPREFTARAGDVLLMHAHTVHSAPVMNGRAGTVRKALFARWHHKDYHRIGIGSGQPPTPSLW
eukprot:COSAG05_NODE_202_length_14312_cov_7.897629_5_plen_310_part_00